MVPSLYALLRVSKRPGGLALTGAEQCIQGAERVLASSGRAVLFQVTAR
jgi:hypothetical protein